MSPGSSPTNGRYLPTARATHGPGYGTGEDCGGRDQCRTCLKPLLRLPWELLPRQRLAQGDLQVGRYLLYRNVLPALPSPAPGLRLLVLHSDPDDASLSRLHLKDGERMIEGLQGTAGADQLAVEMLAPATLGAFQEALRADPGRPTIVHFAGHGDFGWRCEHCRRVCAGLDDHPCGQSDCGFERDGAPAGLLAFTDPVTGAADWIGIDGLCDALQLARDLRLVVLNACKSATARRGADVFNGIAQRLMNLVPAVIATPYPLETTAAEEFARCLYRALGEGLTLVASLHQVRLLMAERFPDEWYRPVLYLRSSQGDGGRLFAAPDRPRAPADPPADLPEPPVVPPKVPVASSANTAAISPDASAARPVSQCPDPQTQSLADALDAARDEEARLVCAGADARVVQTRILDLKRRIRAGGRLRVGDDRLGRYKLVEKLGHGGFATIFKAFDTHARRLVALKVLHGQYGDDKSRVERFFRGARKMAELHHQGIVQGCLGHRMPMPVPMSTAWG